ncbi:MAG: hypothetical protein N2316_01930 [Spirochaetes bacterium]|nr:hypothetical protein [Spirochaetota bacterium]
MSTTTPQRFPLAGLFVIFAVMLIGSSFITVGYFYFAVRDRITTAVETIKSVAIPLCESLVELAAMSYKLRDYSSFKSLVHTKIHENIIDEAFFVLKDGTIVAHSKRGVENELKGNILYDEFAYNIDLILAPLRDNSKEMRIINYNIIGKEIPFKRYQRIFLKHKIYRDIDSTGWLVTKAVFIAQKGKEEPIGTVNFLISKERIYKEIFIVADHSKMLMGALSILSFIGALIISLYMYVKYRKLKLFVADKKIDDKIPQKVEEVVAFPLDESILDVSFSEEKNRGFEEKPINIAKPIRDAIPVRKRAFGVRQ